MPKGITQWTLEDLERMKDFSELDVYYEMLDLLVKLEPFAERATLDKKASKRILSRESRNLKFLSELLRSMTTNYQNSDVPLVLMRRIEKERKKRENADKIYAARLKNLKKAESNQDKRISQLKAAVQDMKRKNEQRKKEASEDTEK